MTIVASAPGKIVLSGEYAVLFGAPAVCVAITRRAVASVGETPDRRCHLTTPGFTGSNPFAVVDAVCRDSRPAFNIDLDTTRFADSGNKIGIGSSAALTVALLAALKDSTDVFEEALQAHAALQGGSGSGIDIAAAVHGGLIEYERASRNVRALDWPEGLAMRVVWTGTPASTEEKLEKLAGQTAGPSRSVLGRVATQMADAWQSCDADRILEEYVPYIGVLRQFSIDHDLGIFDAGHDELTDAAMADDLVYKPAGAGGGDIGVLFGRIEAGLDAFVARHANLVHGVVPCELDPAGVRLEDA